MTPVRIITVSSLYGGGGPEVAERVANALGWNLLDNNPATVQIASYCELYQMHGDGAIWHYNGQGNACGASFTGAT